MSNSFRFINWFIKIAAVIAAFLFLNLFQQNALGAARKNHEYLKIEEAKKKVTSLLLLKQRSQALELIQDLSKNITNPELQKKINQFKLIILSSFLTPEAQDFFELASSQYLSQNKAAIKNIQRCLSLDPEQFLCLWAEAKASDKGNNRYLLFLQKANLIAADIPELRPLVLSLDKMQPAFIDLQLNSQQKTELYDAQILAYILEFDRSILAKNYLLAKESLEKLQQIAPDYIDIIIMRAQLYRRTYSEEPVSNLSNVVSVYKKKCEAVSLDIARKYFFDIDFCRRTLE